VRLIFLWTPEKHWKIKTKTAQERLLITKILDFHMILYYYVEYIAG